MKSKYLIIFLMIILIFLGILWLKYNSSNKEGLNEASASALSSDILGTVESKLSSAGVDTTDLASQIPAAMDLVNKIIENESKAIDAEIGATGQGPPDYTTAIDTTGSDYYPSKSFFVGSKFSDGFCETNSNTVELNNACSTLTAENCNLTDCCVLLQGNKCVAGNALGPTNQVNEKGDDIDYAYYSYKNQCYGSCGKSLANSSNPCSAFAASDKGINQGCMKRLWSQSGCPNGAYINPDLVSSLKDNTKASIQVKFKDARKDEPNYAQCYGPNESRWPVPCNETTDTSIGLSARCLKKLFKDVGCTNTDIITDTYATANELKSKSEMINTFTVFSTADDDSGGKLTKCYGPDESQWPDPCLGVSETANLLNGTMPARCAGKIFKEATKCTSGDYMTWVKSYMAKLTEEQKKTFFANSALMSQWTKAGIAKQFSEKADEVKKNRFQCYGINPNKWDNIMGIRVVPTENDPCASLTPGIKVSDVSPSCKNRLKGSDIFPTSTCSGGNAKRVSDNVSFFIDSSPENLFSGLITAESMYHYNINKRCKPDPPAVGSLYGKWIRDNKYSIPVVAAKYLDDGKTIAYLASEGEHIKMATNTGVAKYYSGSVNDFDASKWDTYTSAGTNYIYSPK